MIGKIEHPERVLNTHYQQPPELNAVELMSCGMTDEGVIEALMEKLPHYGLVPFWVRRESDGFIFNRIWAAIKRECLMVVEEGVAPPEDVDAMWEIYRRKYDAAKTLEGFSLKLRDETDVDALEDVMNFSPYAIASSHGYEKTIPNRRFRRRVGVCRSLPRAR